MTMWMRLTLVLVIAVMCQVSNGEDQDEELELLNRAKPPKENYVVIEELKDMLVVSMQNIVSNNDLVSQLTQKVVQNMLSVGESKKEMENLNRSHLEEVAKLREQIEGMEAELRGQIEGVDTELKSQIEGVDTKVTSQIGANIEEIRGELSQISTEVTIISAEGGLRDQRCAKVCAGTTGRRSTSWVNFSSTGLSVTVDISGCGFVTVPTITASKEGTGFLGTTGGTEIHTVNTSTFRAYIEAKNVNWRSAASGYYWNIEWIAVGYTC